MDHYQTEREIERETEIFPANKSVAILAQTLFAGTKRRRVQAAPAAIAGMSNFWRLLVSRSAEYVLVSVDSELVPPELLRQGKVRGWEISISTFPARHRAMMPGIWPKLWRMFVSSVIPRA